LKKVKGVQHTETKNVPQKGFHGTFLKAIELLKDGKFEPNNLITQ
jgi:hypothetical protein